MWGNMNSHSLFLGMQNVVVVKLLSHVWLFATPWTAACQPSLSFTNSQTLLKIIELVMPSNHLILCYPFLLLPSIFPGIRVFSSESPLHIMWPKYWSFSFSISLSNEYSGLISFRFDWFDLLAVQGTLKSFLQYHSSKASVLHGSAKWFSYFERQLSNFIQTKHTFNIWPNNHIPRYLPKWTEDLCPHKNLHMNVYTSFIYNCQNLKQPRCPSLGEQINKTVVQPHSVILFSTKKKCTIKSSKTWRIYKRIFLSERSSSENATLLYDSSHMTF